MSETMLKDTGVIKNKIMLKLLNSPDVLECLSSKGNIEQQKIDVIDNNIFPFLYVTDTQTKAKSYICFDVEMNKLSGTVKRCNIIIWVYCHKDIMKYYKEGFLGTRVDILSDMVDSAIRNSDIGIGNIEFVKNITFYPQDDYYGTRIYYTVPDFKIKERDDIIVI